jgi:hypothetical protein
MDVNIVNRNHNLIVKKTYFPYPIFYIPKTHGFIRMANNINILKAVIIVLDLVILLFIASIIYPIPSSQIEVYQPENFHYSFSNNMVMASAIVHIHNKSPYSITCVIVDYTILNNTTSIAAGLENLPDIAGNYSHSIVFAINMLNFFNASKTEFYYLVFHSTTLTLKIYLSGYYALGMIKFSVNGTEPVHWPRILNYTISAFAVTATQSNVTVSVPITVDTASYLSGNATLLSKLLINGSAIKVMTTTIPLGSNFASSINFTFPSSEKNYLLANLNYLQLRNYINIGNVTIPLEVSP